MHVVQWQGIQGHGLEQGTSERGAGERGRVGELTHTHTILRMNKNKQQ